MYRFNKYAILTQDLNHGFKYNPCIGSMSQRKNDLTSLENLNTTHVSVQSSLEIPASLMHKSFKYNPCIGSINGTMGVSVVDIPI